ncbi:hypothetical protein [Hoeflea sp.]|uniref:hypothetical protein n=1 Tax=Hoeflea sp. TaxID=1940281 RepID=UPI00198E17B1|nr:hypothetical protein [Hoeflea sp.]MBC7280019.1 hypothetical protein [Hoeflea sp.]
MDVSELSGSTYVVGKKEYLALEALFGKGSYQVTGAHAKSAAQSIVAEQRNLHIRFFKQLFDRTNIYTKSIRNFPHNFFDRIIDEIFTIQQFQIFDDNNNNVTIKSIKNVPIITDEQLDIFWSSIKSIKNNNAKYYSYAADIFGLAISFYLERTQEVSSGYATVYSSPFVGPVSRMTAKIAAIRTLDDKDQPKLPEAEQLTKTIADAQKGLATYNKGLSRLAERYKAIDESQSAIIATIEGLETQVDELSTVQKAALAEIKESLKLDEARKLWNGFRTNAERGFWISAGIVAGILIGVPAFAYWYKSEIIDFLRILESSLIEGSVGDGAVANTFTAFGRLLIITAPLGFIVWLVRLLVRFNMRSMLLMDDARARVVMLDTYLFLIKEDAAVKQDRGAILEALFRRAPGHGSDTAEPPHFTDLLRYGQEGPGSK